MNEVGTRHARELLVVCFCLIGSWNRPIHAQTQTQIQGQTRTVAIESDASSTVEILDVPDCRISVIERAALAGERAGVLQEIQIREGDAVAKGELIVQLRDAQARAALEIADRDARNDIDLRYAKKASELSTVEYSKALALTREVPGSHSEIDVLKLRLAAERSVLQVEQAAQHLEMANLRRQEAKIALQAYQITAPFDGIVLQVQKRAGESIHAGESVVVLANFDRMRIEGFLPAAASWNVRPGSRVLVEVDGGGRETPLNEVQFQGEITFVDPVINEISQQVRVWAEVDNQQQLLKDGMKARMRVRTTRGEATANTSGDLSR